MEDFDFSMSRDNAYYQFYKNAPYWSIHPSHRLSLTILKCLAGSGFLLHGPSLELQS